MEDVSRLNPVVTINVLAMNNTEADRADRGTLNQTGRAKSSWYYRVRSQFSVVPDLNVWFVTLAYCEPIHLTVGLLNRVKTSRRRACPLAFLPEEPFHARFLVSIRQVGMVNHLIVHVRHV